jgi:hypothetical protein
MVTLFYIYLIEEIVGSLILAALYLYVLVTTFSKSKLIRTISGLLLICNLSNVITYSTRPPLDNCEEEDCLYEEIIIWSHCIAFALADLTFALSYWILANEYY